MGWGMRSGVCCTAFADPSTERAPTAAKVGSGEGISSSDRYDKGRESETLFGVMSGFWEPDEGMYGVMTWKWWSLSERRVDCWLEGCGDVRRLRRNQSVAITAAKASEMAEPIAMPTVAAAQGR